MKEKLYSVQEAGEVLHYNERTIRGWCQNGKLIGAYRVGTARKWLIPESALHQLKTEQEAPKEARVEQELPNEAIPERLLYPAIQKALGEHLEEMGTLIKYWLSEIVTPEIFQVSLDYAGHILSEGNFLFGRVREHLPFPELWRQYESWKTKRAEYIDACKTLRKQIREAWTTEGVVRASSFEQPVLRLISGIDNELRYKLYIESSHGLAEVEYQLLLASDQEVVRGRQCPLGTDLRRLRHEECSKETLPTDYDKIAENFLGSEAARRAKQLLLDTRVLEAEVCRSLETALARRAYVSCSCSLCPGQAQNGLV